VLGDLSNSVGWGKKDIIDKLEEKRKAKSRKFYERKILGKNRVTKAKNNKDLKAVVDQLAKFGY